MSVDDQMPMQMPPEPGDPVSLPPDDAPVDGEELDALGNDPLSPEMDPLAEADAPPEEPAFPDAALTAGDDGGPPDDDTPTGDEPQQADDPLAPDAAPSVAQDDTDPMAARLDELEARIAALEDQLAAKLEWVP